MNISNIRYCVFALFSSVLSVYSGEGMLSQPKFNLGWQSASSAEIGKQIWLFTKSATKKLSLSGSIYYRAGERGVLLTVYGIESKTVQSKIVEILEVEQKKHHWRTIYIQFRKREVWIERPSGIKERGDEEIMLTRILSRQMTN